MAELRHPSSSRLGILHAVWPLMLAFSSGCQQQMDHPPLAAACDPTVLQCSTPTPSKIGYGANSGSNPGNPAGDAGIVADAGTLTGQVSIFAADDFRSVMVYDKPARVDAHGDLSARVSANWNGIDPFQILGVKVEIVNWFSVTPSITTDDAIRTFHPVDTTALTTVDLGLVHRSVLDQIYASVTSPTQTNPALAQLALFFTSRATGAPVTGLKVSLSSAQITAYSAQAGWSDDVLATTDTTGLVVLGNIPANGDPGSVLTLSISGTATGSFNVLAVAGAISVATLNISF